MASWKADWSSCRRIPNPNFHSAIFKPALPITFLPNAFTGRIDLEQAAANTADEALFPAISWLKFTCAAYAICGNE
jgi:hypothetical protein